MSTDDWIRLLLVGIPAFGAVIVGLINHRAVQQLHVIVNSRLSELLLANSRADRAEGVAQGGASIAEIQRMIDAAFAKAEANSVAAAALLHKEASDSTP